MRKNYQQARKQKEQARKVRAQEKQQRRAARVGGADPTAAVEAPEGDPVPAPDTTGRGPS